MADYDIDLSGVFLKSLTKTLRSNLLMIKIQFSIDRINSALAFLFCCYEIYFKNIEERGKKTMIYAQHIIIITYIYFARCECVVWDKTEYLLSRLLPVGAGSIIQKNSK